MSSEVASMQREAMAWHSEGLGGMSAEQAGAKSVRDAGFKGYVRTHEDEDDEGMFGPKHEEGFDEDEYDKATPEPTKEEQAHHDEHDEYPDSYYERHDEAYGHAMEQKHQKSRAEDTPDHDDQQLGHFTSEHSTDESAWRAHADQPQEVDLSKGVYATQSHVGQFHIDRQKNNPGSWHLQHGGHNQGYLGDEHPLFVTHQGRLHVIEGHHRVAAALQSGQTSMAGWHHDLDKHPISKDYQGNDCEECQDHHEYALQHAGSLVQGWENTMPEDEIHATATLLDVRDQLMFDVAVSRMPQHKTAHVSTDIMSPLHCPYCGSGAIIGRPDGTIACDFCTSCFTVTIAPQYLGYPQTMGGEDYDWPQGPQGTMDNPAPAEDEGGGDVDEEEPSASVGGASAPPFGGGGGSAKATTKKKSFLTEAGIVLPEDEYINHLAITMSADPLRTAAKIKQQRRKVRS